MCGIPTRLNPLVQQHVSVVVFEDTGVPLLPLGVAEPCHSATEQPRVLLCVTWSSSKQGMWSLKPVFSIKRNLTKGCVHHMCICRGVRPGSVIVMVHTARTALPATLAAVLSRATMWLSGLCIYLRTWSVQGTPSVMLQAVFITAATTTGECAL